MLYQFLYSLTEIFSPFNIFRYITFRCVLALLTSFLISLIFGPFLIRKLTRHKIGEHIRREDSARLHELHRGKQDTPTMGGLLILASVIISTCLWADTANRYVMVALFSLIWLGATGFCDDYLKQIKRNPKGLPPRAKLASQVVLGLLLGAFLVMDSPDNIRLSVPFFKDVSLNLDGLYILFVILVIAGSSNAVNLTDGLDGLAVGIVVMVGVAFAALSYITGNVKFSGYLLVPYIRGTGELAVFCSSLIGAGLGFLWFNCYPASIFMGDVGSLALGGALGTVALLIKKEMLLIIVGGIFVLEALSVILQVGSYKLTGRRLFKIAPLHHHFQFLNWSENKVIVRFWIIAALLALFTLATLKIR
ncbi:MAG: phospho-N-acetylmuramoyl-pentapeptide-transferase [Candidatus Omnitrophica bacterium]|nr:phospho-N-acetylmuramoyl-pentapeptide-transferase [Candidatus Omnitrophota bacterium]